MSTDHVVKVRGGGCILILETKDEADSTAADLNTEFQTDEYYVEPWRA